MRKRTSVKTGSKKKTKKKAIKVKLVLAPIFPHFIIFLISLFHYLIVINISPILVLFFTSDKEF